MSILKVANVHFDAAGTNRIDYLGDDKVRITSANGTVLSGSTTDSLLRITQTGTGEAIRVEDDTNPDSTPFIVGSTGNVLIGRTDSIVGLGVKLDVNGSINCSNIFVNGNVVSGGGSVTVTDQSSVTPLQYITFTTTTTGTASSINVASTKLTFNVDTGTLSSTIFNSTSDINKKTNITQITDAVTLVNSLNGVRFDWKDNGLPSLGVIAQEVEKVLPELVSDEKSVNYNGIIAVLIEAVKDLSKRVEELENR